MKKIKILLKILLITIISTIVIINMNIMNVYASSDDTTSEGSSLSIDDILVKGQSFLNVGKKNEIIKEDDVSTLFIPVGQILVIVANVIILVVVAIMGIKWITSGPEKQAKLKEQLIGLVVSIVVIYGAVGIWTLIKNFMEGLGI